MRFGAALLSQEHTLVEEAAQAGLEPAAVSLTASRSTIELQGKESGSSGGWGRTSGLLVFSEALSPSELHRNEEEILVGIEPT